MSIANGIVLLGGVALFLFGMGLMGDGLKKIAGNKLELVLYRLAGTPLKGLLLGTVVTAAIQSSSATSVMATGFVNSEMMKVRQAISVIMGAIVGTSITGWIIALSELTGGAGGVLSLLSTETLSAAAAVVGIILRMVAKKKSLRTLGDILLGFAVLMFGMKSMSSAVSDLKESEGFLRLMTGFSNPLTGLLIGFAATAVLQSASATVGILQALSVTGAITFSMALPMLLGIALGASIPVIIASVGSTTQGKRAAYSYPVIELLRVVLFGAVFYGLDAALSFSFTDNTVDMVGIALLNTVFRVSSVLVLMPFSGLIERIVTKLIPEKPEEAASLETIRRLEPKFLSYPPLALEQTRIAIGTMAEMTEKSIRLADGLFRSFENEAFEEVGRIEDTIDTYEDKIGTYLMDLSGKDLTPEQGQTLTTHLRVITDLERMSDHARNLAEAAQEISDQKVAFSEECRKELETIGDAIREVTELAVKSFTKNDRNAAFAVQPLEETVDDLCRIARDHHIERLKKGECVLGTSYLFIDLLTDTERISDHCSNVAIAVTEEADPAVTEHEYEKELPNLRREEYDALLGEYRKKYIDRIL